jgi:signal transduction histidine kinase
MVSGIAHEVNTPIGIAVTSSSHIKDAVKKIRKLFEHDQVTKTIFSSFLDELEDAADLNVTNLDKAANLITNFKRTSADQHHFEKDRINLKDYMSKVLSTLVPITKKVGVDVQLKGEDIIVDTYPGAVSQVVTPLITNSCIHGFASTFSGQPNITIDMYRKNQTLHVNYSDNGIGMDDDTIKKIFDPFFTTKRDQGGTGLGMPILHTLISKTLHGDIRVESSVGKGSTFYMSFENV